MNVTSTTETFRIEDLINLLLETEKNLRYGEKSPIPISSVSQAEIFLVIKLLQFIREGCPLNSKEVIVLIETKCDFISFEWGGNGNGWSHDGIFCQNAALAFDNLLPKLLATRKVNILEKTEKTVKLNFVF